MEFLLFNEVLKNLIFFQLPIKKVCKHLLFLSEFWIILNFRGRFKQQKVANQQMDTNLP
jgi:hypothetical protein